MQPIVIYLAKSVICSGILFLYYWLALRNNRFHYYNRFYLLLCVIISTLLPVLNFQWFTVVGSNNSVIKLFNVINTSGDEIVNTGAKNFININTVLFSFALMITISLLFVLAGRIIKLYHYKKIFPVSKMPGFDFINTDLKEAPFSFLKNIFWRDDVSLDDQAGRQILQHEITHIRQKHTWDKLFIQIILSVFWINPFYWLLQKELYIIHEFIADEKAIENKDSHAFASMLLHSHFGKNIFAPAQSFSYSPIKRRLFMLTTSQKSQFSYARRLLALPLIGCTILLFAFRLQHENHNLLLQSNSPFKIVVDAGHGGTDMGATGDDGLLEKNINLSIAKKIKELSPEYGIDVLLTRDDDVYKDLAERLKIADGLDAKAFISVHTNVADAKVSERTSGMEIYVSKDNIHFDECKILGSAVLQSLGSSFKVNTPLMQRRAGIWVLKENTLPSILIECGYMDNISDAKILSSDAQISLIARKILEGAVLYATHTAAQNYDVQNENAFADTLSPKVKMYDNKKVKIVDVIVNKKNDKKTVIVIFDDNTKKQISYDEAVKYELVPPLPPLPPSPQSKGASTLQQDTSLQKALYVIDGKIANVIQTKKSGNDLMIVDKSNSEPKINVLHTEDIKTMNVLKGKDATDKYADKGRNGVIEITTKLN